MPRNTVVCWPSSPTSESANPRIARSCRPADTVPRHGSPEGPDGPVGTMAPARRRHDPTTVLPFDLLVEQGRLLDQPYSRHLDGRLPRAAVPPRAGRDPDHVLDRSG